MKIDQDIGFEPVVGSSSESPAFGTRLLDSFGNSVAAPHFGSSYFRPGDIMTNSSLAVVVGALAGMAGVTIAAPALTKSPKHVRYTDSLPCGPPLQTIDQWIKHRSDTQSRPEAIRRLVEKAFASENDIKRKPR